MRKGRDGEKKKNGKKKRKKKREKKKKENTDENSGHYVVASSRTPTAGAPHARANDEPSIFFCIINQ